MQIMWTFGRVLTGLMLVIMLNLYYRITQGKTTFDNKEVAIKQFVIPVLLLFVIRESILIPLYHLNIFPIVVATEGMSALLTFSARALIGVTIFFIILKCLSKERITGIKIGIAFMAYIMDFGILYAVIYIVFGLEHLLYSITALGVSHDFITVGLFYSLDFILHVVSIPIHFGIYQLIKRIRLKKNPAQ